MSLEAIIASAVLGAALLLLRTGSDRPARRWVLASWLVASLLMFAGARQYRAATIEPRVTNRPIESPRDGYTSSDACRSCHPAEYESWHHSWHRTMTQVVRSDTAIGDFTVGRLSHGGAHYDLERDEQAFWVNLYEPGLGGQVRRPIALSTGSHHMQVYWFSLADGVRDLGMLPFFYLNEDARWVPRDAVFIQPERTGPPGIEPQRWNLRCVFCHSTNPRPRATPQVVDTEATELGIACEACHGPGGPHVRANTRNPLRRYRLHLGGGDDDTIVQPARLEKARAVEVCGQCHGVLAPASLEARIRSFDSGYSYRPGEALTESGRIALRSGPHASDPEVVRARETFIDIDLDTSFWPDGMTRVPREYNSLLDTPCYQRGDMTCQSCHVMHRPAGDPRSLAEWSDDQLAAGMRTDDACVQCHTRFGAELEAHTHHAPESEGSRCQNCHMPYTTYALLKAIRQHQIDVPTVAASVETGRPNACNACHLDKSLGWAAAALSDWYGRPEPQLDEEQRRVAASALWMLTGDAAQRALAAWYAGWGPARSAAGGDWLVPHLAQLLDDPYPAVRYLAWRSLRSAEGFGDLDYDFVADAPTRDRARAEAWRRWNTRAQPPGGRASSLLLAADGTIDARSFAELLAQRNDRYVYVAE